MMPQQMTGSMSAMSFQQLPQQMPLSMPALQQPQQVPKAYSTNYTVPMELMKRDRNLPPSPMHSPHPSPQMMRKTGGPNSDCSMVAVSGPIQGQGGSQAPMQKTSRRTGPPVIMSSMASPDLSKTLFFLYHHSNTPSGFSTGWSPSLSWLSFRGWHDVGAHLFLSFTFINFNCMNAVIIRASVAK